MRYIAKPDTWYDAGTEAKLLCYVIDGRTALFEGILRGRPDEEVCGLDEFEVIDDADDRNHAPDSQ